MLYVVLLFFLKPKPVIVTPDPPKIVTVVSSPPVTTKSLSSIESPGDVATAKQATDATTNESGPRVAGARRSTERIRKKSASTTDKDTLPSATSTDENKNTSASEE